MKLKKFMKLIDPIVDVIIWTNDDNEEPSFEGSILNIPWWYLDLKIGRRPEDSEEPIYISEHTNKFGHKEPCIVINLLT